MEHIGIDRLLINLEIQKSEISVKLDSAHMAGNVNRCDILNNKYNVIETKINEIYKIKYMKALEELSILKSQLYEVHKQNNYEHCLSVFR